jgi:PIN domain nuclease of toxin-antitoxin system
LWFVWSDPQLSERARSLIEDAGNQLFLSAATAWELAIKISTGKLSVGQEIGTFLQSQIEINHLTFLPVSIPHSARVATLPFHHKDPFDRMLIAQSLDEDIPIITNEVLFEQYGIQRYW